MAKKELFILRGIPGSGKSTYARQEYPGALIVSADDYFMQDNTYAFDPDKLQHAHEYCFRTFLEAALREEPIIVVDNTNIELYEISPYLLAGQTLGYQAAIISLVCDTTTAEARGIHDVPTEVVRRKAERMVQIRLPSSWPHQTLRTDMTDYHQPSPV